MTDPLKGLKEKMKFEDWNGDADHLDDEQSLFHSGRETENARLQFIVLKEVGELVEALEFYASEKNWFGPGAPFNEDKTQKMIIASVDTEGNNWLGGRTARKALAKFGGGKGDS